MNQTTQTVQPENNIIRTMVRGAYDLQKLRIQMGNRVAGNFRAKLGMTPDGMTEDELEKEQKKILDRLRESYRRITDGIVSESGAVEGKFPTAKQFKGDELISSWTELVLVDQYMVLLRDEEKHFDRLGKVLTGIPIYDNFLSKVRGCGTAMAGVILSEINIHRAEYPSSLWAYAGLDSVYVAEYTDSAGKVKQLPAWQVDAHYEKFGDEHEFLAEGKYPIKIIAVGRSRREVCLVDRAYINKEGEEATRRSITYNPFLKTKLVGVLGTSFLRSGGSVLINGDRLGSAKRVELAKSLGYTGPKDDDEQNEFLRKKGYTVTVERSEYAAAYYNYKARIENDPRHAHKSDGHRHAMALRYAVKRFLVDLYKEWRKLEGLPVAAEYSEGKLGKVHKKAA